MGHGPTLRGMRSIAANLLSLLASDLLNRVTVFVLYALVARYLGAIAFGQVSVSLTLFYIFQVVAVAGLRTLIAREVARDRSQTARYLASGLVATLGFGLLALLLLWLLVTLLGYSATTRLPILLLGLGLVPFALSQVCEAIFQGWERMHLITYANGPMNLLKVAGIVALLEGGYGVAPVLGMLAALYGATAIIELIIVWRMLRPQLSIDRGLTVSLLWQTLPFLGLDGVIAVWDSLNVLMLSRLTTEADVGLYSAANQLLVPTNVVLISLALTAFPILCKRFDLGLDDLKQSFELLSEFLLALAVPSAVGLFLLAEPLLVMVYGAAFAPAAVVLTITAWGLIPIACVRAFGQVQLASLRERVTLRIVVTNMLVSLAVGLLLISTFGVVGAAVAALVSQLVGCMQHYLSVSRFFAGLRVMRVVWKAAAASLGMALYIIAVQSSLPLWLTIGTAAVLYGAVWLGLAYWAGGGLRQWSMRPVHHPSE